MRVMSDVHGNLGTRHGGYTSDNLPRVCPAQEVFYHLGIVILFFVLFLYRIYMRVKKFSPVTIINLFKHLVLDWDCKVGIHHHILGGNYFPDVLNLHQNSIFSNNQNPQQTLYWEIFSNYCRCSLLSKQSWLAIADEWLDNSIRYFRGFLYFLNIIPLALFKPILVIGLSVK